MKNISDMIAESPKDLHIIKVKIATPKTEWPPVSVEPAKKQVEPKLTEYLKQIKTLHKLLEAYDEEIKSLGRYTLDNAIKIGELLDNAKKELDYGKYGAWVKENCPFSITSAGRYVLLCSHVNKLKDCQTIREAYIRLGLLKVKIIEVPLGEAEALKIRPGEKPKEPAPKPEPEKPKEPRKFFDENEKEITAAQFRNNCIKQINDWTLRDISALDLDLSHWSVENGSVMAPGDNSDRLDELCNSIWTKGTLKGDVAEVFTEKEYFQVKSRAVIFALFECLIKSNQTEALPI